LRNSVSNKKYNLATFSSREMTESMGTNTEGGHDRSNLIIHRDLRKTNEKRRSIVRDGIKCLHVVLDFDHTITAYVSPTGQKCLECHDVIQHGTYQPIERQDLFRSMIDEVWSDQHNGKLRHISEWWIRFHDAIISQRLTKAEFQKATALSGILLRPGAVKLFAWLRKNQVKTTIVSAGISTVIEEVLKQNEIEIHEQAEIIANVPVWEENGSIVSFKEPLIHARNKEQVLKTLGFSGINDEVGAPYNVVLAGNSIGDVLCLLGICHKHSLSLGFLHEKVKEDCVTKSEVCASSIIMDESRTATNLEEELKLPLISDGNSNLEVFLENFDIVSCGHHSNFQYLLNLLSEIEEGYNNDNNNNNRMDAPSNDDGRKILPDCEKERKEEDISNSSNDNGGKALSPSE